MKRTQRNLLVILTTIAIVWLILRAVPALVGLWIALGLIAAGLVLVVLGRGFFAARRRMRKREWQRALDGFKRFEQKLLTKRWTRILAPLYLGIYTFDGVAIVRNNIAVCLMRLEQPDEAVQWLRAALQRDPLYAVPYVNLATIAALRNDESTMKRELTRAVDLGYSPVGAQRILMRLLARGGKGVGPLMD